MWNKKKKKRRGRGWWRLRQFLSKLLIQTFTGFSPLLKACWMLLCLIQRLSLGHMTKTRQGTIGRMMAALHHSHIYRQKKKNTKRLILLECLILSEKKGWLSREMTMCLWWSRRYGIIPERSVIAENHKSSDITITRWIKPMLRAGMNITGRTEGQIKEMVSNISTFKCLKTTQSVSFLCTTINVTHSHVNRFSWQ